MDSDRVDHPSWLETKKNQLIVFQDQVKTINKSYEEGDEIIHQLNNETNQYMNAS
jgi:hypothetical protein